MNRRQDALHFLIERVDVHVVIDRALRRRQQCLRGLLADGLLLRRVALHHGRVEDHLIEREGVNFIARRHDFFFEHEINFFEAGLHFLERKDAFIYNADAERGQDRMAGFIADVKIEPRLFARQIGRFRGVYVNFQFIRRLNKQQLRVADDVRRAENAVGVELQRTGRRRDNIHLRLPVAQVNRLRQERLAVFDQIEIDRAGRFAGKHAGGNRVAELVEGFIGAQKNRFGLLFGREFECFRDARTRPIFRGDGQRQRLILRHNRQFADAGFVGWNRDRRALPVADVNAHLRGRPVRITDREIKNILHARHNRAAFGDGDDRERVRRDGAVQRLLFLMLRRVRDRGFDRHKGVPLLKRLPDEIVRQFRLKFIMSVFVRFALQFGEFLKTRVEFRKRDKHRPARDRLAEKVINLRRPFHGLTGLIKLLVRLKNDLEFRQDVTLHRDGLFLRVFAEDRPNFIRAFVDLARQLKIGGADAEFVRLDGLFEDFIPFGIFDFQRHLLLARRKQIGLFEGEAANAHDLTRLIKRLVGRQQNLKHVFDRDGLANHVFGVV